jgi:hypothetical protein
MTADGVTFETTLKATGNNTGIVVPPEALEQLGAGKRPAVAVTVNGYAFDCTIGSMGGRAPSLQRYHVDNIEGAKTPETRQRRIEKAVALFAAGKSR